MIINLKNLHPTFEVKIGDFNWRRILESKNILRLFRGNFKSEVEFMIKAFRFPFST